MGRSGSWETMGGSWEKGWKKKWFRRKLTLSGGRWETVGWEIGESTPLSTPSMLKVMYGPSFRQFLNVHIYNSLKID